jgi:hypothetical protein
MKKWWNIIPFLFLFQLSLQAQFTAVVDTSQIKIGEPILLQLEAKIPLLESGDAPSFSWPNLADGVAGLEVIEIGKLDSSFENGQLVLRQTIAITSFDSGIVSVPVLKLRTDEKSFQTDSIPLLVYFPDIKEDQDYFEIKGQESIAFNYMILVYYIIAALALGLLFYYLIRNWKKKPKLTQNSTLTTIPPVDEALLALRILEEKKLWQDGQNKVYYSELTAILQQFLERQFALKAKESTAKELIIKMKPLVADNQLFERLKSSLNLSAMVKFAKFLPLPEDNHQALSAIRSFVISYQAPKATEDV